MSVPVSVFLNGKRQPLLVLLFGPPTKEHAFVRAPPPRGPLRLSLGEQVTLLDRNRGFKPIEVEEGL